MRSFRNKILLLTVSVVAIAQIATSIAVLRTANKDVSQLATQHLMTGGNVYEQLVRTRGERLRQNVQTLSNDFAFRQAVASEDTATINSALTNHARRVHADIALMLGMDGSVRGNTTESNIPAETLAELTKKPHFSIRIGNRFYEIVTVPVRAPLSLGWVSMGFLINDALAQEMGELAGLDVSFVYEPAPSEASSAVAMIGSSLPIETRTGLSKAIDAVVNGANYRQALEVLNTSYMSARHPFLDSQGKVFAVLQKSVAEAMAPYVSMRQSMIQLTSITLVIALLGAFFVSRTVTRPVRDLVLAARRLRVGNYSKQVTVDSKDEFGELAKAFNAMQQGIAEREQRVIYQAQYDALTGLPNRLQAMDLLRKALARGARSGDSLVILVMHLQRFREIQSSLGHEIGDEVLRQTAQRLRAALDDQQILARLEGDQFLIVLPGANRASGIAEAENLAKILDAGLNIQEINVTLDACIGVCICPEHGRQENELLRRATVAKNDAQHSQKRIHVYQNGREARHVRQLAILGDLRRATTGNELKLFLQPKVNLVDSTVCGAEALLRWEHPELGNIPPVEFIPLAESAGNISLLTNWVMKEAVAQVARWRRQGIQLPIAVNLSARDLLDDNLPYMIMQNLAEHKLNANCLILEVTEEALVQDVDHAALVLKCLRDMGAKTSMDDFGVGYSSLSHLQNLPVDEIKIDRSFVMDLPENRTNQAIVKAVLSMAHSMGKEVVAEGVENVATLRWLREHGCERAQGYYMSRPLPAEEFTRWLEGWSQPGESLEDSMILRPRAIG